jgi:crotonobetainyl-CoA:carnitine CoA-transferase CaiB-like acyl-CoA transferase
VLRLVAAPAACHRDGGFIVWDRGKDVLPLDLDAAVAGIGDGRSAPVNDAARTFRRLIAGADVLLDDLAPRSPHARLIDRSMLRRINQRLIAASITAYGKTGPLADEPAIDDLVLARMGVLGGMPGFRPAPVHVVHPLPSVGSAVLAGVGIAGALLARETTGRGRAVETSLMAGALLYHPKVDGERIPRHVFQTHPAGSAPFYSNYRCADGRYVQLGCVHPRFIAIAAGLMGLGEKVKEPRFDQGRGGKTPADVQEMRDAITAVMATRAAADWMDDFEKHDVPFAPCRLAEEGMEDAQVRQNGMVVDLDDPVRGRVTQMGVPIAFSATSGRIGGPRAAKVLEAVPADWAGCAESEAEISAAASGPGAAALDGPPLAGVRILEITNLIAGPTCGRLLADLGADVIKLEPPGGDMSRPIGRTYFYHVNFEKRSVCVDTSKPAGKAVVQRIAKSSDALVANLRPIATERMGITRELNPRLVETHLTGYGWTGPYAHRPGIDPLAQALMGLQRAQGGPENPPVFPAQLAPTDYTTGALGALGTILALYARKRTGVVQRIDANLLTGGILLSSAWFTRYAGKPERPLADKGQHGLSPFHRLYRLSDGWIYMVAQKKSERAALLAVAGLSAGRLDELPPTGTHPAEAPLARDLAEVLADKPMAQTLAALRRGGVPCAEAQAGDSENFLEDPHAAANGMVAVRQHPKVGRIRVQWQSIQFPGSATTIGRATPLLGEHTAEVLAECGYAAPEIADLHTAGTVITERVG